MTITEPTMTEPTLTCPAWCRTDHDAERAGWQRREEESLRYMSAPENLREMRFAFGPGYTPPTQVALPSESPMHEQEIGSVHVLGQDNEMVPVRVVLDQLGQDEPAQVAILAPRAYYEDAYSPAQARALAALLVEGADMLERAGR